MHVYRGRGVSVISARFILARTTADKSNGRSVSGPKGRRGEEKGREEEGRACFILRASSMMHKYGTGAASCAVGFDSDVWKLRVNPDYVSGSRDDGVLNFASLGS